MKVAVFSTKNYDRQFLSEAARNTGNIELSFFEARLDENTALLANGHNAVCVFVNDALDKATLRVLNQQGVRHIALRCAGFNNLDSESAKQLGFTVARVPAYSPQAVAEHTVALLQCLNRKLHKAYNRVKENNFSLEGLLGFNLQDKTVGIVGTGQIGKATVRILNGYGCKVLCYDPYPDDAIVSESVNYCSLDELFRYSDIISLHCPLSAESQHMINRQSLLKMKDGVVLINTSRGGLIDTKAVIEHLKTGKIGQLGLDVYEMESELFFEDKSQDIIQDDVFQRLLTFPNVLITGHQGFFTDHALHNIATVTLNNLQLFRSGQRDNQTFLLP